EGEAKIATLSAAGEGFTLKANAASTLLILSGAPIHEPVASYGPFVMNTKQELIQAVEDYKSGKMGFLN
ncbi:MAG TPA: pirin-like C-terminal cupin domain-containing protein, partial [Acidobacteriaceae bacterium]|nr:pirin-like C-terminal cupin domain-containing protein [Acidobacteriaceae bacterium]